MSTMKRAIFVVGQKGGEGKTNFACVLVETLRHQGVRCAAYDVDPNVGRLTRLYGERDAQQAVKERQYPLRGVQYLDIRNSKERDMIVNAILTDADVLLFDLAGGTVRELGQVFGTENDTKEVVALYRQTGFAVTIVSVITPEMESVGSVADALVTFGNEVDYLVVENHRNNEDDEDFAWWHGFTDLEGNPRGGESKKRLLKIGGTTITMAGLKPSTVNLLNTNALPFR